jgi:hypothetical protein
MSVPEALAWLETSANSHSPSTAQIYARTVLNELTRLSEQLNVCARELDKREQLRHDAVSAHRALEAAFDGLEERARSAREQWDIMRTDLETRLTDTQTKLGYAESTLKDIHFGLLKQPELTREDLANAIESAVVPYPEGATST